MTSHTEQANRYDELDADTQAAVDRLVNAIASHKTGGQMEWSGVVDVFVGIVYDTGREITA